MHVYKVCACVSKRVCVCLKVIVSLHYGSLLCVMYFLKLGNIDW